METSPTTNSTAKAFFTTNTPYNYPQDSTIKVSMKSSNFGFDMKVELILSIGDFECDEKQGYGKLWLTNG